MDIEEVESEKTDLSQDIEAAMNSLDQNLEEETVEEPIEAAEEISAEPESDPESKAQPELGLEPESTESEPVEAVEEPVNQNDTAPDGLPAAVRQQWKDLPEEAKSAFHDREKQFAQGIFQYEKEGRRAKAYDAVVQPHQQLVAMNGNNPPQLISNLLQTAASLQLGSTQESNRTLAQLVTQFCNDLPGLDRMLSEAGGMQKTPQEKQQEQELLQQQQIDQRVQKVFNQRDLQQQTVQAQNYVEEFSKNPKNEFYSLLYNEIIYALDGADARGEDLSLQEAYDQQCLASPIVQQTLASRNSASNMGKARGAAKSINGSPGGAPVINSANTSMSDDVRMAMEQIQRRV
jgi:hypothetical protein